MSTGVQEYPIQNAQEPLGQYDTMQVLENIDDNQTEEITEENSPKNQGDDLDQKSLNWWQVNCQEQCFTCNSDLMVEDFTDRKTCTECGEGQNVARPCCVDPFSN